MKTKSPGRAAAARRQFTKYPRWGDGRPMSAHPNYGVCRNFRNRVGDTDGRFYASQDPDVYRLCPEWFADLAAFVYGTAREIGVRPGVGYDLKPIDPAKAIGPGNVRWQHRGWASTARAQAAHHAYLDRRVALQDGSTISALQADALRHQGSCESAWLEPIECPCTEPDRERLLAW